MKPTGRPPISIEQRFWSKVNKTEGCWLWTASTCKDGYGRFWIKGPNGKDSMPTATRISYELTYGKAPEGVLFCHTCDNPSCVRPDHLFIGTIADNNKDRDRKNRQAKGNAISTSVLNEDLVRLIRQEYAKGLSSTKISAKLKLNVFTVRSVLNKRVWKHVA